MLPKRGLHLGEQAVVNVTKATRASSHTARMWSIFYCFFGEPSKEIHVQLSSV